MRHAKAMEWETAALRTGWQRRACPRGGLRRSIHDTAQYTMSMPTLGGPSGSSLLLRTSNTVCCGAMSLLCEVVSKREICTLQGVATRLVLKALIALIVRCAGPRGTAHRGAGGHTRDTGDAPFASPFAFALRPFALRRGFRGGRVTRGVDLAGGELKTRVCGVALYRTNSPCISSALMDNIYNTYAYIYNSPPFPCLTVVGRERGAGTSSTQIV